MNIDVKKLTKGETGERVNLKAGYDYMVEKKYDSKKMREEYIKYLIYKLIQNLDTPGVKLLGL